MPNTLYDTLIIGGTVEALTCYCQLQKAAPQAKIALIAPKLKTMQTKLTPEPFEHFQTKIIYSTFQHGIICFLNEKNERFCCKSAIIATGTSPIKSTLKSDCLYYSVDSMPSKKNGQVIIYGEGGTDAIKAAISLARKYRYVYLCTPTFRLRGTEDLRNRLQRHKNVVHLPNTNIKSCKRDKNSEVSEVVLDTYNTIHADAILMLLGREGDPSPLNKRMVEVDTQNKIIVKSCNETTLVPNIFAIGDCAQSQNTLSIRQIVNTIITRLNLS